jgi:hypothetical protein
VAPLRNFPLVVSVLYIEHPLNLAEPLPVNYHLRRDTVKTSTHKETHTTTIGTLRNRAPPRYHEYP